MMRVKRRKDTCSQFRAEKRALSKAIGVGLRVGGTAMVLSMSSHALSQSSAVVELSELDGSDGFVINGVDATTIQVFQSVMQAMSTEMAWLI